MKSSRVIVQIKATHLIRAVELYGTVYYAVRVVLTFESVDEILKCDRSNESYSAVLSLLCCTSGSNF